MREFKMVGSASKKRSLILPSPENPRMSAQFASLLEDPSGFMRTRANIYQDIGRERLFSTGKFFVEFLRSIDFRFIYFYKKGNTPKIT